MRATESESREEPRSLNSFGVRTARPISLAGFRDGRHKTPVATWPLDAVDRDRGSSGSRDSHRRRIGTDRLRRLGKWGQQQEMALDDRRCDVGEFASVALRVGA